MPNDSVLCAVRPLSYSQFGTNVPSDLLLNTFNMTYHNICIYFSKIYQIQIHVSSFSSLNRWSVGPARSCNSSVVSGAVQQPLSCGFESRLYQQREKQNDTTLISVPAEDPHMYFTDVSSRGQALLIPCPLFFYFIFFISP